MDPRRYEDWFIGLELGLSDEHTAFAVIQRLQPYDDLNSVQHAVRHLERFPLGTSYPAIADRLGHLFQDEKFVQRQGTLVVDRTGTGTPVIDLIRRRDWHACLRPVTFTAGNEAQQAEHGGWLVPKPELVAAFQVTLQERRLLVAPNLALATTLLSELHDYRLKAPLLGNDALLAWREGPHDDLVLAVALAVWDGERTRRQSVGIPTVIGYWGLGR